MPFLTNNVVSITAGVYEQHKNTEMAICYTRVLYYLWTTYCGVLAIALIICGTRLIGLLQQNLRLQQGDPANLSKIKAGVLKVKLVTFVGTICLSLFVVLVLVYAIFRAEIMNYIGVYYFMVISWTFDGTITSIIVVLTLIINPYTSGVIGNLTGFNSTFTTTMCDYTQESTLVWNNMDKKRKSLCSMNMDLMPIKSLNNNNNNDHLMNTTNIVINNNHNNNNNNNTINNGRSSSSSNNKNTSNITAPSQRKLRSSTSISSSSISLDALPPLFANLNTNHNHSHNNNNNNDDDDESNTPSISSTRNLATNIQNISTNPIDTMHQDDIITINQQRQSSANGDTTYFHFTTY
ncbi:unnamed protein product [Cunninghamella blakesleeana]